MEKKRYILIFKVMVCVQYYNLSVNNWNKLEHIRERKGIGRRGAEFTNLKFQIYQDSSSTDFVYISYDRLID